MLLFAVCFVIQMYFFKYVGQVIVLLNLLITCNFNVISYKMKKDQAFLDVLKNITIANKILQDLIMNYERIEKIYQSEELLHSDSSSSELDETFKSLFSNKQNAKQRDRSYQKYTTTNIPYIGTAIIYDSESIDKDSEDSKEDKKKLGAHIKQTYSKDINDEKVITNTKLVKKKADGNSSENIESDEVEEIIIEMPKDKAIEATTKLNQRIIKNDSNKTIKNILGEKTRFNVQYVQNKITDRSNISKSPFIINNNGRRIKRIVYSETFSPDKIWHDIINKPVKLRRDPIFYKSNKPNLRSKNNQKITIFIITNNENENDTGKGETERRTKEAESNTKEDLTNLDLLNKILRNTYGEACLQMPIKKCKKAIKTVSKNVCKRRFKCKSDFKSDFIESSKMGCDKEFAYKEEIDNTTAANVEKFSPPEFREKKKSRFTETQRGQYKILSKYKLQPINHFISLRNETPQATVLRIRALRDKYEKRCQKESRKKCINACNFATNETCSIHTCENKQKKAFKSECKDQCKKAYKVIDRGSSNESGSDEDSDSESDSGSD